ncbi:medium chain dehydrogenase/reductase family protein [Mesorhizobium sp. SEMIA 3007]|uniref:zinc-dependent alcohol dehydrogenase n=1 Tax=Mesorhizobium sp. SEMIA 3007 TaxID=1862350 RepID=UPI001495CA5E|nr:medium chain dehydrogenase/reductase family protein [Mesorhizobium sp. SEMIA 3007]
MPVSSNRVARLISPRRFILTCDALSEDLPADFVRIKIEFCGVCGTDRSFYLGHRDEGYPISLGHEHCGSIVAVGDRVTSYQVGDFVAIDPNFRCGSCFYCRTGAGHLCESSTVNWYSNRGYAKFVDIRASYLLKLPEYRSRYLGALVEPLSVAINAADISKCVLPDEATLVLGIGGIGTLLVFNLLETQGGEIWIHDKDRHKMAALKDLYPSRIKILDIADDRVFNVVFEATGSSDGFLHGCGRLAKLGRLIVVSRYHSNEPAIPDRLPWKQPNIYFVHLNGHGDSFAKASALMKRSWGPDHDHLLSFHPLGDIDKVFAKYGSLPANKKIISME